MLRGLAMVWMTLFHFSYDLQHFGYLHTNFYADPFWTVQRASIVSLFVFCAGLGQAIAVQQAQSWRTGTRTSLRPSAALTSACAWSLSLVNWSRSAGA